MGNKQVITIIFEGIQQNIAVENLYKIPSLGEIFHFRSKAYTVVKVESWITPLEPFRMISTEIHLA